MLTKGSGLIMIVARKDLPEQMHLLFEIEEMEWLVVSQKDHELCGMAIMVRMVVRGPIQTGRADSLEQGQGALADTEIDTKTKTAEAGGKEVPLHIESVIKDAESKHHESGISRNHHFKARSKNV